MAEQYLEFLVLTDQFHAIPIIRMYKLLKAGFDKTGPVVLSHDQPKEDVPGEYSLDGDPDESYFITIDFMCLKKGVRIKAVFSSDVDPDYLRELKENIIGDSEGNLGDFVSEDS